ncbi:MAG: hypothetical protein IBJ11_04715 [Phycisphaerales bacterium]|nr:hypothetical protein [Phycisphaerales bacterium]
MPRPTRTFDDSGPLIGFRLSFAERLEGRSGPSTMFSGVKCAVLAALIEAGRSAVLIAGASAGGGTSAGVVAVGLRLVSMVFLAIAAAYLLAGAARFHAECRSAQRPGPAASPSGAASGSDDRS